MSKKKKKPPIPSLSDGTYAIDTHCHLDMDSYADDCHEVIRRAADSGVGYILTIGIDLPSSEAALTISRSHHNIYCAVGIHPHNVMGVSEDHYLEIAALAEDSRVKAYGEIGLDYARDYAPHDLQIFHFRRQVALAKELGLPLIVHDREAHEDVMTVLREAAPFPAGGVMHCFSGDKFLAREVVALGFFVSVPGVVTFNKAEVLHEAVRAIPLEALLLETDGPFLTPVPYRGKRNEPAFVLYTAQKVAELKGVGIDEVVRQTTVNANKLFGLDI